LSNVNFPRKANAAKKSDILKKVLFIFENHVIDTENVTDNAYCKAYNDPIKLRHFCLLALGAGIQIKAIIPHTVKARISGLEK